MAGPSFLHSNADRASFWRRPLLLAWLLPAGAVLGLHAYLGSYTRYLADDFCSVYFARRLDMLRYVWYWYLNWGGRYSAIATDSLVENIGAYGVRFVPLFVLALWTAVTTLALHQMLRGEPENRPGLLTSLSLAVVFLFVLLSVSPMVQQVLYWWNGMRTYIPALISLTFHAGFLFWARDRLDTRRGVVLGSAFSFLLALFSGGYNETFTAIQLLLFAGWIGLGLLTKWLRPFDRSFSLLAAALAGSAVSLGIMLVSPGTANRQTFFTPSPDLLTTLDVGLQGYLLYLAGLFDAPEKVLALVGLFLAAIWLGCLSGRGSGPGWLVPLSLGSGILLSFASLVPAVQATSEMPAPRTLIVPTFVLMASLLIAGLLTGQWLYAREGVPVQAVSGLAVLAVLFLFSSAWMIGASLYESRGTYASFAQRWEIIDAQILQAKHSGEETVVIPAPQNWAGLDEPTQNPRFWVNECYSLYYQIQVLGTQP